MKSAEFSKLCSACPVVRYDAVQVLATAVLLQQCRMAAVVQSDIKQLHLS